MEESGGAFNTGGRYGSNNHAPSPVALRMTEDIHFTSKRGARRLIQVLYIPSSQRKVDVASWTDLGDLLYILESGKDIKRKVWRELIP